MKTHQIQPFHLHACKGLLSVDVAAAGTSDELATFVEEIMITARKQEPTVTTTANNIVTAPLYGQVRVGSMMPPRTYGLTVGYDF